MDFFWDFWGIFWDFSGTSLGLLWEFYRISIRILWKFYRNSLAIFWQFFGNSIGILWKFCRNSIGILWKFYRNALGIPWGILWEFFGNSLGILWEFFGSSWIFGYERNWCYCQDFLSQFRSLEVRGKPIALKNTCTLPSLFLQCHHTSTFFNSHYWLKFKTNKHISGNDQVGTHNPLFHLRHDLLLLPLKRFIFFPSLLVIKIVIICLS